MAKRQRMGWWFLCLACVVVMVCTAQRMERLPKPGEWLR